MGLASAADEAEAYPNPHAAQISKLAEETASLFDLGPRDIASIRFAALAHDLGELVMQREYIKRSSPLNEEERCDLERHPTIGEREAARIGVDRGGQLLIRWHHEWWNGMGYPDHLEKEQIPLGARILRVADAYASLTDTRPYREARSAQDALKHLAEWAGLEFDPRVVRAFLSLRSISVSAVSTGIPETGVSYPSQESTGAYEVSSI